MTDSHLHDFFQLSARVGSATNTVVFFLTKMLPHLFSGENKRVYYVGEISRMPLLRLLIRLLNLQKLPIDDVAFLSLFDLLLRTDPFDTRQIPLVTATTAATATPQAWFGAAIERDIITAELLKSFFQDSLVFTTPEAHHSSGKKSAPPAAATAAGQSSATSASRVAKSLPSPLKFPIGDSILKRVRTLSDLYVMIVQVSSASLSLPLFLSLMFSLSGVGAGHCAGLFLPPPPPCHSEGEEQRFVVAAVIIRTIPIVAAIAHIVGGSRHAINAGRIV